MKTVLLIGAVLFLAGCGERSSGGLPPGTTIPPASKILIMPIADAVEPGQPVAQGTGAGMVAALRDDLSRRGFTPFPTAAATYELASQEATKAGFAYVLRATIPEYADNATAWSGKPDILTLDIELLEPGNWHIVSTAYERVGSSAVTLVSGSPNEMMGRIVRRALDSLLGQRTR